jgi:hypothetical protein
MTEEADVCPSFQSAVSHQFPFSLASEAEAVWGAMKSPEVFSPIEVATSECSVAASADKLQKVRLHVCLSFRYRCLSIVQCVFDQGSGLSERSWKGQVGYEALNS